MLNFFNQPNRVREFEKGFLHNKINMEEKGFKILREAAFGYILMFIHVSENVYLLDFLDIFSCHTKKVIYIQFKRKLDFCKLWWEMVSTKYMFSSLPFIKLYLN